MVGSLGSVILLILTFGTLEILSIMLGNTGEEEGDGGGMEADSGAGFNLTTTGGAASGGTGY